MLRAIFYLNPMAGEQMYNRYIPQPDGSYQRRRVEEPSREPPQPAPPPPVSACPPPQPEPVPPCSPPSQAHCRPQNPPGFLQQLLPHDFDMGDLMVIVLLLLIAGECEQERSNALLTLALYFIM